MRYLDSRKEYPSLNTSQRLQCAAHCCVSCNFEHFSYDIFPFCLQSCLIFCTFRVLSNTLHKRCSTKPTIELEKHPPLNTFLILQDYKLPRIVALPATSNTFCAVSPLLPADSPHILHFSGTFKHFSQRMFRKTTIELEKHPPPHTSLHYPSIFTATRMFRACFHS